MGSPRDIDALVHDLEKDSRVMAVVVEPSTRYGPVRRVQLSRILGLGDTLNFLKKYEETIVFVEPYFRYKVNGRAYYLNVPYSHGKPLKRPRTELVAAR